MSEKSSMPVFRISQSALTYIVLVLALGALILLSSNIDPDAAIRAANTPVPTEPPNYFVETYQAWQSPDEVMALEYPTVWEPQADPRNGPYSYVFVPPGQQIPYVWAVVLPLVQLRSEGLPESATLRDYIKVFRPDVAEEDIRDEKFASYEGVAARQQVQSAINELWLLQLNPDYVLILIVQAQAADWSKMEPILAHFSETFSLKLDEAAAELAKAFAPPTATPTTEPTEAATEAPTAESTEAATAEPTEAATEAPTAEPTEAPTVEPTEAATEAPTAEPTEAAD